MLPRHDKNNGQMVIITAIKTHNHFYYDRTENSWEGEPARIKLD